MKERTITRKAVLQAMKWLKDEKESLFYFLKGYFNITDEEILK